MNRKQSNDLFWATALIIIVGFLGGVALSWINTKPHAIAAVFSWLAWMSIWARTRGMDVIGVLLCAAPVVLAVGAFLRFWNEPQRGVNIHGQHYEDVWRDD